MAVVIVLCASDPSSQSSLDGSSGTSVSNGSNDPSETSVALADTSTDAISGTASVQEQIDPDPVDEESAQDPTIDEMGPDLAGDPTGQDDASSGRDPVMSTAQQPEESSAEPVAEPTAELTSERAEEPTTEPEAEQVAPQGDIEIGSLDGSDPEAEAPGGPAAETLEPLGSIEPAQTGDSGPEASEDEKGTAAEPTMDDEAGLTGEAITAVSITGEIEPETISAVAAARVLLMNSDESGMQAIEADGAVSSEAFDEPANRTEAGAEQAPGADAPATGETAPVATFATFGGEAPVAAADPVLSVDVVAATGEIAGVAAEPVDQLLPDTATEPLDPSPSEVDEGPAADTESNAESDSPEIDGQTVEPVPRIGAV